MPSAIPRVTPPTNIGPLHTATPYEVWNRRRLHMPRPMPNPGPYGVHGAPPPGAPPNLGDMAAFAKLLVNLLQIICIEGMRES